MFYGLDGAGNRVSIDEAERSTEYRCPCCSSPLVQKRGNINVHHFAHKSKKTCDEWYGENKGEWHRWWQSRFPEDCQEVRIDDGKVSHIADCKIGDYVFEFQHSPMSRKEFCERTIFYGKNNYVVWLFDYKYKYFDVTMVDGKATLRCTHPKKTIDSACVNVASNVTVFIEFTTAFDIRPKFLKLKRMAKDNSVYIGDVFTKEQMIKSIERKARR